jgi:hypothetical protein
MNSKTSFVIILLTIFIFNIKAASIVQNQNENQMESHDYEEIKSAELHDQEQYLMYEIFQMVRKHPELIRESEGLENLLNMFDPNFLLSLHLNNKRYVHGKRKALSSVKWLRY